MNGKRLVAQENGRKGKAQIARFLWFPGFGRQYPSPNHAAAGQHRPGRESYWFIENTLEDIADVSMRARDRGLKPDHNGGTGRDCRVS